MLSQILERLSTAAYDDPTLLLENLIGKYDLLPQAAYAGYSIEIYATSCRLTELVVSWESETIVIYKRVVPND